MEIDGNPVHPEFIAKDDLTYQAKTTNRGGKTAVQATKGTLREASTVTAVIAADQAIRNNNKTAGWVALGAGLFAIANQSQADTRQWELLPDRLELIFTQDPLSAGRHQYVARFSGRSQNELSSMNQVWYDERNLEQDRIYIVNPQTCGYSRDNYSMKR